LDGADIVGESIGFQGMAKSTRKSGIREIPLAEVKDDLSHLLREATKGDIVITRHGKPAGVSSDSSLRMIGSSIGCKTIRGFCDGSKKRVEACVLVAAHASGKCSVRKIPVLRGNQWAPQLANEFGRIRRR